MRINAKFAALFEHAELFARQFKRAHRRDAIVLVHLDLAELAASPDGPSRRLAAHGDLDILDQISNQVSSPESLTSLQLGKAS
jgi:hypothetical protein